jgi:hypothetical protein
MAESGRKKAGTVSPARLSHLKKTEEKAKERGYGYAIDRSTGRGRLVPRTKSRVRPS